MGDPLNYRAVWVLRQHPDLRMPISVLEFVSIDVIAYQTNPIEKSNV